jgi:hypothetical protein
MPSKAAGAVLRRIARAAFAMNQFPTSESAKQQPILTANSRLRGCGMCDKCTELDGKIEHYERIRLAIADQITIDRIKELVAEMNAQKANLHPEMDD